MNKNKLINYLKDKNVYVISPHFDDAILSMGMLLYILKPYGITTVINVFTKAHNGPYTLSARKFIQIAGYDNADDLFNNRMEEDKKALNEVHAKFINFDLTECLFRKKTKKTFFGKYIPEFDHIYPTYRWHVLKKIQSDDTALKDLKTKLEKVVPADAVVFVPLGIGNHADHCLTRNVCESLFKNVYYYADYPYNIRQNISGTPPQGYKGVEIDVDLHVKSKLAHHYKSQIYGLFPGGIVPKHREKYFLTKEVMC